MGAKLPVQRHQQAILHLIERKINNLLEDIAASSGSEMNLHLPKNVPNRLGLCGAAFTATAVISTGNYG